jgi:glutathione peroxidase
MKILTPVFTIGFLLMSTRELAASNKTMEKTSYDFSFKYRREDKKIHLSDFQEKVILMFNRHSKCGCTSQDSDRDKLYTEHKCKGSTILGGPSNDFGDNADIATFYRLNDGAILPVTQKAKTSGNDARPCYKRTKDI